MKKTIKILLCLGLLLQNFAFISPVYANGSPDDPEAEHITITGVTNCMTFEDLPFEDNMYILDDFNDYFINYQIENYDEEKTYTLSVSKKNDVFDMTDFVSNSTGRTFVRPDYTEEVEEYYVRLCEGYSCDNPISSTSVKIKISRYEEIKDSKIYITKVLQGEEEITDPIIDYEEGKQAHFEVNNVQKLIIGLKGENLLADGEYEIGMSRFEPYTGSELEEGIEFEYTGEMSEYGYHPVFSYGSYNGPLLYKIGDVDYEISFEGEDNPNFPNYDAEIKYSNYDERVLKFYTNYYLDDSFIVIDYNYHNAKNPLKYVINGRNFEDKDYNLEITVTKGNTTVYNKKDTINGLLLNDGYDYELTGLNLGKDSASKYNFKIEIYGIYKNTTVMYANEEVVVDKLYQNKKEVTKIDDVYQVEGFKYIYFDVFIKNYIYDYNNRYVVITNPNKSIDVSLSYKDPYQLAQRGNKYRINPKLNNETEEYSVLICDNSNCNVVYAVDTITIKHTKYNEYKNSKIYISEFSQNGENVQAQYGEYQFNKNENVTYKIQGENLIDDAVYTIREYEYNKTRQFLGSELEEGIYVTHYSKSEGNDFMFRVDLEDISINKYYYDTSSGSYTSTGWFNFKNNNSRVYYATLDYLNPDASPETESKSYNGTNYDYSVITPEYHDSDNPLIYRITGLV